MFSRWEQGSTYHLFGFDYSPRADFDLNAYYNSGVRYFGTGCQALSFVVKTGIRNRGWKRLFFPSYYCQDVVEYVRKRAEITVERYSHRPFENFVVDHRTLAVGDALVVNNFGGLEAIPSYEKLDRTAVDIIEDYTHTPFCKAARHSTADVCFASLRKTVPLPDGAIAWSPSGRLDLTQPKVQNAHRITVLYRVLGMFLKRLYLKGAVADKRIYLAGLKAVERCHLRLSISGMTMLSRFFFERFSPAIWHQKVRENYLALERSLANSQWFSSIQMKSEDTAPYCFPMIFRTEKHAHFVRRRLVDHHIYPPALWPIKTGMDQGVTRRDVAFGARLILILCDLRYTPMDMMKVAHCLNNAIKSLTQPGPAGTKRNTAQLAPGFVIKSQL